MQGFSWVIENELAGMPLPGRTRPLEEDLDFLRKHGIELLFSLTEASPIPEVVASYGIELVHLPVKDFTAPTLVQLRGFLAKAHAARAEGRAVGVHCGAGKGRTGTFLAAYLIAEGNTPAHAIARVRELRPGSIETAEQEQVLVELHQSIKDAPGHADDSAPAH
jgi:atypical dual specificity phosphatase